MKSICFSCPTVLLRRPIAEIISRLKNRKIGLTLPKDIVAGLLKIHHEKVKCAKIYSYKIINGIHSLYLEWPIPVNPFFFVKIFRFAMNYDIIHLWVPFYIGNSYLAVLKRLFFKNKLLFLTMDTIPGISFKMGKLANLIFKIYYRTFGRWMFSLVDKIILYGKSMIMPALKAGLPMDKIEIIPTGVEFKIKEKDKNIRSEFNIKDDEKIILFAGLLVNNRKGVDIIIKTVDQLRDHKIKVFILGDGRKKKLYEKMVKKFSLEDKIIFTGFRRDIHNFYHEADLFFLPSRGEGLAGVIMESMLYKVPIISSDIIGTRDLIINNFNGFLCKTEKIDCYKTKILKLLYDGKIREKFVENSYKRIRDKFNWNLSFNKYQELYLGHAE